MIGKGIKKREYDYIPVSVLFGNFVYAGINLAVF
jgi:hypothetical protein